MKTDLKIGKCCGSCEHVNRPKVPNIDHAPHYSVAKTERWCFKNEMHTTRESCCDDWQLTTKSGVKAAQKRVQTYNNYLQKIIEIKNWMIENKVKQIPSVNMCGNYIYILGTDDKIWRWDNTVNFGYHIGLKDMYIIKDLIKSYERFVNEKKTY